MAFLNLKGDYGIEILSYYLWGESKPPSSLAKKDNRVLIDKNYKPRDKNTKITIEASALEYMQYVDRYTNATSFGVFNKFFNYSFSEKELQEFKHKIENGICTLELKEIAKILYKDENKFGDKDENKFTN